MPSSAVLVREEIRSNSKESIEKEIDVSESPICFFENSPDVLMSQTFPNSDSAASLAGNRSDLAIEPILTVSNSSKSSASTALNFGDLTLTNSSLVPYISDSARASVRPTSVPCTRAETFNLAKPFILFAAVVGVLMILFLLIGVSACGSLGFR